jgi:flagellar basal body rod protein FlgC
VIEAITNVTSLGTESEGTFLRKKVTFENINSEKKSAITS